MSERTLTNATGSPVADDKGERFWFKWHFKSNQGIKNLSDEQAACAPPFGAQQDLVESPEVWYRRLNRRNSGCLNNLKKLTRIMPSVLNLQWMH